MVENKDLDHNGADENGKITPKSFLLDMAAGFGMGVAFIIPGFSGGSVAAILGIYEKLISAIANIFTDFKRSFVTLFPVFLGLVLGAVSFLYPLGFALETFPLPTAALFVGLALGGMFSVTDKIEGRLTVPNYFAFIIPFLIAFVMMLLPTGADVDLFSLDFTGYVLLFIVGVIASMALVIPGISGSMILLMLGYYNPIIKVITENFLKGQNMLVSFYVLMSVGLGIVVGFISVSIIMKRLFEKFPRGTYVAIVGFILGSIPSVFVSVSKDAGYTFTSLPTEPIYWIACVALLALGFAASYALVLWSRKNKAPRDTDSEINTAETDSE